MDRLKYDARLDGSRGYRADAVLGDTIFEVLIDPRDLRRLRASLMEAGLIATRNPDRQVILIIDEPQISEDRLKEELEGAYGLFRPETLDRICVVIRREGQQDSYPQAFPPEEVRKEIENVADHVRHNARRPSRRPSEAYFDILRVLLIHWFRERGPIASKELGEQAGFSYPTIAKALDRLKPYLHRHSDRRVELRELPREEWFRLVAQSGKVRASQGFADRSGRPRPIELLVERLAEQKRDSVALGGVLGSRHYLPGLDLVGTPRLDLIIHKGRPRNSPIRKPLDPASLVRKLDPALVPAERGDPPRVVVHTLFRPEAFFTAPVGGNRIADEVECALDLHDARLEEQALEFIERLTPPRKP